MSTRLTWYLSESVESSRCEFFTCPTRPIANFAHDFQSRYGNICRYHPRRFNRHFDLVAIHNYHLRDTVLVLECEILAAPRVALIARFSRSSSSPTVVPSICIGVRSIKSPDLSYKIEANAMRDLHFRFRSFRHNRPIVNSTDTNSHVVDTTLALYCPILFYPIIGDDSTSQSIP